jgi:AcrR family transcriptional regulator
VTGDRPLPPVRDLRPGRQRILDTARRLFCARGYERTPVRAISDALGVTKAAVYYHFKAKDDLLDAIVAPLLHGVDEILGSVAALAPPVLPVSDRRAFLGRYVDELRAHPDVTALLLRDRAVGEHAAGRRFAALQKAMRALLGGEDSLVAGIRTTTALRALETAVVDFGDADPAQVRETALDIALAVLRADARR